MGSAKDIGREPFICLDTPLDGLIHRPPAAWVARALGCLDDWTGRDPFYALIVLYLRSLYAGGVWLRYFPAGFILALYLFTSGLFFIWLRMKRA